ncbi:restriction endonuclease subunit S [Alloalcanivorax xenomutans]|uniref:restriction endonuclease subunit S n=1 Tax=Alloalcanivorax xenomutans TaxID=1094342 RepID=UPI00293464C7|nr:restriction endonuclease subunit S [Alloalcanivorax xenomutans]WOD27086.1 restriction endonuclease subunit S [Alloalcanivorax xenomutans]
MSETRSSLEDVIKSKPEDWEERRLGDLFKQRKEKNRPDLPLLAVTGAGGVVPRDSLERRDTSNADKSKYLRVCEGDIAYNTMRMWQGVSGLSAHEGIVSPAYTICQPVNGVSSGYMSQLFKLPELIQVFHRNSQGLVDDTLNLKFENFSPIRIPVPPLPEQQKIAAILSSVDDVIEKTRAQIDKLKGLKTGMMQELLTKGIGHTAFKDSPVGRIPEGWDVVYISDVCTHIVDCVNKTAPVVDYVTPFKMIRTTNVRDGRILTEGMRYVTQETFQSWSRRLSLRKGDLIFTREAPVGECGLVDNAEGLFLGQRTMVYRADPQKLDNRFLLFSLLSEYCQSQIEDLSGGSTTPHLRVPDCSKIIIKVPPMEEQKEISSAIHSVFDSIDTKERKVTQLIAVKKALMQDLLTGKVRVNVDNKENAVA